MNELRRERAQYPLIFYIQMYIGENLIKTMVLLDFLHNHSLSSYLITIDFEKVFDCLDKQFMYKWRIL